MGRREEKCEGGEKNEGRKGVDKKRERGEGVKVKR